MGEDVAGVEAELQCIDRELERLADARADQLISASPATVQPRSPAERYGDLLGQHAVLTVCLDEYCLEQQTDSAAG